MRSSVIKTLVTATLQIFWQKWGGAPPPFCQTTHEALLSISQFNKSKIRLGLILAVFDAYYCVFCLGSDPLRQLKWLSGRLRCNARETMYQDRPYPELVTWLKPPSSLGILSFSGAAQPVNNVDAVFYIIYPPPPPKNVHGH